MATITEDDSCNWIDWDWNLTAFSWPSSHPDPLKSIQALKNLFKTLKLCVPHLPTRGPPYLPAAEAIENHFRVKSEADWESRPRGTRARSFSLRERSKQHAAVFVRVLRDMPSIAKPPILVCFFVQMFGFSRWKWRSELSRSPSLATLSWLAVLESLKASEQIKQTNRSGGEL